MARRRTITVCHRKACLVRRFGPIWKQVEWVLKTLMALTPHTTYRPLCCGSTANSRPEQAASSLSVFGRRPIGIRTCADRVLLVRAAGGWSRLQRGTPDPEIGPSSGTSAGAREQRRINGRVARIFGRD